MTNNTAKKIALGPPGDFFESLGLSCFMYDNQTHILLPKGFYYTRSEDCRPYQKMAEHFKLRPIGLGLYGKGDDVLLVWKVDGAGEKPRHDKIMLERLAHCFKGHREHDDMIQIPEKWFPEFFGSKPVTYMMSAVAFHTKAAEEAKPVDPSGPDNPRDPADEIINHGLTLTNAATVKPRNINYVWPDVLAFGYYTGISGDGGKGKSQIAYDIGSRVSTAAEWPDGSGRAPLGTVLILNNEDGQADVMVPRLMAAGANLSNIEIVHTAVSIDGKKAKFALQRDIDERLKPMVQQLNARPGKPPVVLVIIDPIGSYMGGTLDTHRDTASRDALDPLNAFAADVQCAVVSIGHTNKGHSGKAVNRVMGSKAFTNAPRAAFQVMDEPGDDSEKSRLMLVIKTNIGEEPPGLRFHVERCTVGDNIKTSRIVWDGTTDLRANEVARAEREAERGPSKLDKAKEWLAEVLADGQPHIQADVKAKATKAGISEHTLLDAKRALSVKAGRDGMSGPGTWQLIGGEDFGDA
jgi:putative DNA primase/helicase